MHSYIQHVFFVLKFIEPVEAPKITDLNSYVYNHSRYMDISMTSIQDNKWRGVRHSFEILWKLTKEISNFDENTTNWNLTRYKILI